MKTTRNFHRPLRTTSTKTASLQAPFERPAELTTSWRSARLSVHWCQSVTCVCLMLFLTMLWTNSARAQGALTNGLAHDGAISAAGETDTWTIAANQGGRIIVQITELSGGAGFTPRIELFAPDGATLGVSSGGVAARLDIQANVSGTFTVGVRDLNQTGTGTYRLRLAQVPGVFTIPAGDEGGALTNGQNHSGIIDPGDLDLWTVAASQGDRITVQIAELSGGAGFTPMIELFAPNGARLGIQSGGTAARLDVQAAVSGTFTVLVSDASQTGSGSYQLQLAHVPGSFVVPTGDEGGTLPDAVDTDGSIVLGDLDLWTFTASPGDHITLQATELTGGANFAPMIELFTPNGERKGVAQNASAATIDTAIEVGGTYTMLVSDANQTGAGTYRLHLTRGSIAPPGANVLTNGGTFLGSISSAGETNTWTFTASAGESIVVRMGETATAGLIPWLRLYGPNGVLLTSDFNAAAAEVTARATNSGTFMVVAADGSAGRNQTGNYRISLAKTGAALEISPTDEGGSLTNGATYLATIDTGDIDAWTFTANAGENIVVRMGEVTSGSTLLPWLRLYGPNGVLLNADFNAAAAEVTARATNSGTFLVVAADGNNGWGGIGNYRISLAKTGSPLAISPTDEGGSLTNGATYLATIDTGDIDAWTFTADAGENIVVRMGETAAGSTLLPWLRLYGPNGVLLSQDFNAAAAEVTFRATNSGTFLVVATDGNNGWGGIGNYRISLAKTGSQPTISPGDEGGTMSGIGVYVGTIDVGDLDVWTFTACAGDAISINVTELVNGGGLSPWFRLYGRDGVLLNSISGPSTAQISRTAPASGSYTVVIGDGNSSIGGSGTYQLTVNSLSEGLKLCIPIVSGTNVNLAGIGGVSNATFILFTHTNVTTALALWTPILTNQFDQFGVFSRTNTFNPAERERYFRLLHQ